MKDQVLMSTAGEICVGIPLFRRYEEVKEDIIYSNDKGAYTGDAYVVSLSHIEVAPLAYILDIGIAAQVVTADFVKKYMKSLGDL